MDLLWSWRAGGKKFIPTNVLGQFCLMGQAPANFFIPIFNLLRKYLIMVELAGLCQYVSSSLIEKMSNILAGVGWRAINQVLENPT